jgi:hypothetical protein
MKRIALAILLAAAATLAAPTGPHVEPRLFTHATHARLLDMSQCATCHAVDATGTVVPPAAIGHSPCLAAKCHASEFVSTGASVRSKDPAGYAKATAFCLGCHDSTDGSPPSPAQAHVANAVLRSYQLELEYHVELNHFEHTKRVECRACHAVDPKSFALATEAPGHAQCVTCHNAKKFPDFTMAKCAYCHQQPGRASFFHASRPRTDVRACGSEGHAALVGKFGSDGKGVACFRHERAEHRATPDGKPVQCDACHAVVATPALASLSAIHSEPVIDNSEGEHHRCGDSAACHASDFSNTAGAKHCLKCHGDHSRSLFD